MGNVLHKFCLRFCQDSNEDQIQNPTKQKCIENERQDKLYYESQIKIDDIEANNKLNKKNRNKNSQQVQNINDYNLKYPQTQNFLQSFPNQKNNQPTSILEGSNNEFNQKNIQKIDIKPQKQRVQVENNNYSNVEIKNNNEHQLRQPQNEKHLDNKFIKDEKNIKPQNFYLKDKIIQQGQNPISEVCYSQLNLDNHINANNNKFQNQYCSNLQDPQPNQDILYYNQNKNQLIPISHDIQNYINQENRNKIGIESQKITIQAQNRIDSNEEIINNNENLLKKQLFLPINDKAINNENKDAQKKLDGIDNSLQIPNLKLESYPILKQQSQIENTLQIAQTDQQFDIKNECFKQIYYGIQNKVNTCYINSALQMLRQIHEENNQFLEQRTQTAKLLKSFFECLNKGILNQELLDNLIQISQEMQNQEENGGDSYLTAFNYLSKIIQETKQEQKNYVNKFNLTKFQQFFTIVFEDGLVCVICQSYLQNDSSCPYLTEIVSNLDYLNHPLNIIESFYEGLIEQQQQYFCYKCKQNTNFKPHKRIGFFPQFIIVKLPQCSYQKIKKEIDIVFDQVKYQLIGYCNYSGIHYTYTAKYNNKWINFNDSIVNEVDFDQTLSIYQLYKKE